MTTATDGKAVYTSKKRDDATRGYSALPRGLSGPIPGLGHRKWFLNCAHGPAPFVCPVCKHGFAGIHKRGEVCIDCSTEAVMLRGAYLEQQLGINLGCKTANIGKMREMYEKSHRHHKRTSKRALDSGIGRIGGYHGHGRSSWVEENSTDNTVRAYEDSR